MNSDRFEDPYGRTNTMDNTNDDTHLIDAHDDQNIWDAQEEEKF